VSYKFQSSVTCQAIRTFLFIAVFVKATWLRECPKEYMLTFFIYFIASLWEYIYFK